MAKSQRDLGRERRAKLLKIHGGKCLICGQSHPAALDFHHPTREDKGFDLNTKECGKRDEATLLRESLKCMLVCSSCHRIEHARIRQIEAVLERLGGLDVATMEEVDELVDKE